MPRNKSTNEARHIARIVDRRVAQHDSLSAKKERGYRVPEVDDSSNTARDGDVRLKRSEYMA